LDLSRSSGPGLWLVMVARATTNRCRLGNPGEDESTSFQFGSLFRAGGKVRPGLPIEEECAADFWRRAAASGLVRFRLAASGWLPTEIERLSGVARSAAAAGACVTAAVLWPPLEQHPRESALGSVVTEQIWLRGGGAGVLSAQTLRARLCWPRKAAAPQRGRAGMGVDPSMHHNYATPTPSSPPRLGLTWRGFARCCRCHRERPALRQCYWAAPGLECLVHGPSAISVSGSQRTLGRVAAGHRLRLRRQSQPGHQLRRVLLGFTTAPVASGVAVSGGWNFWPSGAAGPARWLMGRGSRAGHRRRL